MRLNPIRLILYSLAVCSPSLLLAQPANKELREKNIENISSVLFDQRSKTNTAKLQAFENATGTKLHFKVDEQSLDELGGLSEHLFKLWQTFVTPINTNVYTITGEFSTLGDSTTPSNLNYKTYATPDLRNCLLPDKKTDRLDSLYNTSLNRALVKASEVPNSIDGFYADAAFDYQKIILNNTVCPNPSGFNAEVYNTHVNNSTADRAARWALDINEIEILLNSNYQKLEGSFIPPVSSTGLAPALDLGIKPENFIGNHIINENQSVDACTQEDMEVRCQMLYAKTNIRYLFLTKTLSYYIPLDSIAVFRDAVTKTLVEQNASKNIIVVLWLKVLDGGKSAGGVFEVRQTGDWLSQADINFANNNNVANYTNSTLYKFLNIYRNIPKPLVLCYQVAKVNGLLTTAYFHKGEKVKGREQIYYHSFKLDRAFEKIKQLNSKIYSLNASNSGGGSITGGGAITFNSKDYEEIDELRNQQKLIYVKACMQPDFNEADRHVKEVYLQDKNLVHAAGINFLKENYSGIYPENQMDQQIGKVKFPDDLLAGSCKYKDQSKVVEDILNISSLLLSPVGLDFIPDALSVAYYASTGQTLEAFLASASFFTPGSLCGAKKLLNGSTDVFSQINKGNKLLSDGGQLAAIDQDVNLMTSLFKINPSDVDPTLVKKISENGSKNLLPATAEQAKVWSNTEKLDPKKRVEFINKCYDEPTFAKKCLDDPEEVLRWGGVGFDLVRGVKKTDFVASVAEFASDPKLGERAWELFRKEEWSALEDLVNSKSINSGWPPNSGFINTELTELPVDFKFDRYGGEIINGKFNDRGSFVADLNANFEGRALPTEYKTTKKYTQYRVIKAIPKVKRGKAIPWFDQKGQGIQYELPVNINDLISQGYIEIVK